ncbi:hypothetical protein L6164_002719 [Bauhinia variegata]|uniref:Uncharacterized protein n=1 Tax=Bauhinia variegata TaxID=167791 RepID=A0ACB9Q163_BAUVA|nr:hypothetical protein L6164_002719 [Bauhinia variegata]
MADTKASGYVFPNPADNVDGGDDLGNDHTVTKKSILSSPTVGLSPLLVDPVAALANARHVFGKHGGLNVSIEASATFRVIEPESVPRMFSGELGSDRDFFIYSRHFNPTVLNLSRQMAALQGTEAAYCTSSGMSEITSVLLNLCSSGGHVVTPNSCRWGPCSVVALPA